MELTADTRGQIFTIEALVAVSLLITVVLFVAPALVDPVSNEELRHAEEDALTEEEIQTIIDAHEANGNLKHALLDFTDGPPDTGGVLSTWQNGPGGANTQHHTELNQWDETDANSGDFNPLFTDLWYFEQENNARVTITLDPVGQDEVLFLDGAGGGDALATHSTTITIYDEDGTDAPPQAFGTPDNTASPTTGDPVDESYEYYPIENVDPDDDLYNIVEVTVTVYSDRR